jgi:uncharacterized protein
MEKINKCLICNRLPTDNYSPFCSKRCADVDLGKWLSGSYIIPTETTAEEIENKDYESLSEEEF